MYNLMATVMDMDIGAEPEEWMLHNTIKVRY